MKLELENTVTEVFTELQEETSLDFLKDLPDDFGP